jgi:hypothetical protein
MPVGVQALTLHVWWWLKIESVRGREEEGKEKATTHEAGIVPLLRYKRSISLKEECNPKPVI